MSFHRIDPQVALRILRKPFVDAQLSLRKGLCDDDNDRRAQINAMRVVVSDPDLDKIHAWIHTNLIILDAKAQSILSLYSIALATLAIFYTSLENSPKFVYVIALIGFMVIAWSIIPLARIAYAYWNTTDEFADPEGLLVDLLRLRDRRTRTVRISILKGILSLLFFAFVIIWSFVQHF